MSVTSESKPVAMPGARAREVLGDFTVFLEKRNPSVELHYELYDDSRTQERVLSITALAYDGHVLKHELRRKVPQAEALSGLYRKQAAIDCGLMRKMAELEAACGVKITPGRWC